MDFSFGSVIFFFFFFFFFFFLWDGVGGVGVRPVYYLIFLFFDAIGLIYGTRHANPCLWAYEDSEGSDQPAHPLRLIRAFAFRKKNHWIL